MSLEALQNGRYRRLRLLGGGGMGEVYLMEDTRINRQVAIKIMRAETSPYPGSEAARDAARLFQREARAVAALDHPNILPIYDFGEEPLAGATLTYMVMPYCPEGSFAEWLRQRSSTTLLSPQDVASFITQAADALQYAHDRQVLHLDVKPSNFLTRSNKKDPIHPTLLLADFGVARMSAATSSSSRTVRGTPTSMAPEQWSSTPVPATDQYALAVMAYELLVGRPPFLGSMEQLMFQHFQAQPPAPSTFNPRLSKAVDAVLLRALAKRPQDRFPTISAFAEALQRAVQSLPPQAAIKPPEPSPSDIRATLAISKAEALAGTNRTLTLPGGRKVSVSVPAGAHDGQVIRLPNLGDPTGAGISTGDLILTLAIQQAEPATFVPDSESAQQTRLSSTPSLQLPSTPIPEASFPPTVQAPPPPAQSLTPSGSDPHLPPTVQASDPNLLPIIAPPPPPPGPASPPVTRPTTGPSRVKGRTILLIALALLLIAGSVGLFSVIHNNQVATTNAYATATTIASQATGTTTGQNATATAQNATATAYTDSLTATAQAYAAATASVIAANPDPYGGGTLAFYDPLRDNSNSYWSKGPNAGGDCEFPGDAYHTSQSRIGYLVTCVESTDFSNFAVEVRMTIVKGDCGGLVFRADTTTSKDYIFEVCQDGSYALLLYVDNNNSKLLASTTSSAINTGLNVSNVLAVVANGSTLDLYMNKQKINSVTDSTYSHGIIGVIAGTFVTTGHPTEVVYSNVRVWTF